MTKAGGFFTAMAAAAVLVAAIPSAARAANSYDGNWSVTIYTQVGNCPSSLRYAVRVARGRVCGVPALVFRVSFTGELGFEINVPADYGLEVWKAIWAAGQSHGICPYGTESMHVLRAEKGYVIVGQDTDGTVTADDAGLSWAVGKAKTDFLGHAAMRKPALTDPNRKQLVGLLTADPETVLEEGSQIAEQPGLRPPLLTILHFAPPAATRRFQPDDRRCRCTS